MPKYRSCSTLAVALYLAVALTGCSDDKKEPDRPTSATPTPDPVPTYAFKNAEEALLDPEDLGKKWTRSDLSISAFKEDMLRSCSNTRIPLPGDPETSNRVFGEPKYRTRGATYARFIAVYPSAEQAAEAMNSARDNIFSCPANKKFARKKITEKKFIHEHNDTWKPTEGEISGWRHLRGSERTVYPPYISNINVIHIFIDYAQRGNMIFSSIYSQRTTPKESGRQTEEEATELLEKQLTRFA